MFHRLFTGKSQGYAQAIQALDKRIVAMKALLDEAEGLRKRVGRLEIEIRELTDMHNALDSRVGKLSGAFYGTKGGRPPKGGGSSNGDLEAIPHGDKDALRARVGLRAGVRYQHTTEE